MMKLLSGMVMAVAIVATSGFADAQTEKARDDISRVPYGENAYHAAAGRAYRRHARDHARLINERLVANLPVSRETLQEHTAAIRTNMGASRKHHVAVRKAAEKNASAEKLAATIDQYDANALAQCERLEREAASETADLSAIRQACADLEGELTMATKAHEELATILNLRPAKTVAASTTASGKPRTAAKPVAPTTTVKSVK